MVAESAVRFEALESQAAALTSTFKRAGYEQVAPAVLQPAELFLDRLGEAIRGRTYVFTDNDGQELCLRPDLTVPVARLYLERHPEAKEEGRYCYNGPAFRYQQPSADAMRPREFRQAGIEYIGGRDRELAEAEVLGMAVKAVRAAGLVDFRVRLGDLELFGALIDSLGIPERWRLRLRHAFWRPPAFRDLVQRLASGGAALAGDAEAAVVGLLDADAPEATLGALADHLDRNRIPLEGTRTLEEIAERLLDHARDGRETPLDKACVQLIEDFCGVSGPPRRALSRIEELTAAAGIDIRNDLDRFRRRLDCLRGAGVNLDLLEFNAEFGRDLEYYSGLVFQIEVPALGHAGQIAGGGRYDTLLQDLGAPHPVPAVGSAIHTERLLAAAARGGR